MGEKTKYKGILLTFLAAVFLSLVMGGTILWLLDLGGADDKIRPRYLVLRERLVRQKTYPVSPDPFVYVKDGRKAEQTP